MSHSLLTTLSFFDYGKVYRLYTLYTIQLVPEYEVFCEICLIILDSVMLFEFK